MFKYVAKDLDMGVCLHVKRERNILFLISYLLMQFFPVFLHSSTKKILFREYFFVATGSFPCNTQLNESFTFSVAEFTAAY